MAAACGAVFGRAARVCLLSTSVHARPRAAAYVAQIPRRADAGAVYMRSTLWLYADGEGVEQNGEQKLLFRVREKRSHTQEVLFAVRGKRARRRSV